jgi:hypothetical protein
MDRKLTAPNRRRIRLSHVDHSSGAGVMYHPSLVKGRRRINKLITLKSIKQNGIQELGGFNGGNNYFKAIRSRGDNSWKDDRR